VIDFAVDDWTAVHPRSGRLDRFVTPRRLAPDTAWALRGETTRGWFISGALRRMLPRDIFAPGRPLFRTC
jgi:hypothetical protein